MSEYTRKVCHAYVNITADGRADLNGDVYESEEAVIEFLENNPGANPVFIFGPIVAFEKVTPTPSPAPTAPTREPGT